MVASSAPPRSATPQGPDGELDGPGELHGSGGGSIRARLGGTGTLVAIGVAVAGSMLLLAALVAPRWLTDDSSLTTNKTDFFREAGHFDYLVSSPAIRSRLGDLPSVQDAVDSSIPVAAFGADDDRVEIRRILPGGMPGAQQRQADAQDLRLRAGASLAANPNLTATADAVDAMKAGQVDERLLNVIATLVVQHHLQIGAFPTVDGEDGIGAPRRIVEIDGIDFQTVTATTPAVASLEAFLDSQLTSYRPADVAVITHPTGSASLRVTYAVADPNQ